MATPAFASVSLTSGTVTNVPTPSANTDAANKAYVDNIAAALNPAVVVKAATTAAGDTSGLTYANGASGIGATLIGTANTAITIDGVTFTAVGQRLLVKNDTQSPSGAFNGVYMMTVLQASLIAPVFTRALDFDQPSDMNNTGAIPVVSGTVNGTTSWLLTSTVTTVGTDALVFTKYSANPSTLVSAANLGVAINSGTVSINGSTTLAGTAAGTLTLAATSGTSDVLINMPAAGGTVTVVGAPSFARQRILMEIKQGATAGILNLGTVFKMTGAITGFTITPTAAAVDRLEFLSPDGTSWVPLAINQGATL